MAEKSFLSLLRETFSARNLDDWKHAAGQEIDGQDPFKKLAWKNADGLTFLPYYDHTKIDETHYLKKFQALPRRSPHAGPGNWINLAHVPVSDALTANQLALSHLQHGGDGLLIDLPQHNPVDFDVLLNTIDWPYCTLSFRSASQRSIDQLQAYIEQKHYPANTLHGTLFWEDLSALAPVAFTGFENQKNIRCLGVWVSSATPVTEIVHALTQGVALIEHAAQKNDLPGAIVASIAFSLAAETNLLHTIAKFKTLRMLWFQVAQAYGLKDYTPDLLDLHARADVYTSPQFGPRENLISGTTAALAAVLGNCNALTVFSADNSKTSLRIARNVSNILREESHLDKVADPLAGSFAVDTMVHELAQEA
ncbi:MAG TPA: methylmalonyl-CoA mutase family protein, partial [Ohtaekwangia sp.]|nr:methylmalonyl-CoA mutase family protein [Ohtaekwangia sp.]